VRSTLGQRKQADDIMSVMTLRFAERIVRDNMEQVVRHYSHAEVLLSRVWQESASKDALDVCLEATKDLWAAVRTHWIERAVFGALLPRMSGRAYSERRSFIRYGECVRGHC